MTEIPWKFAHYHLADVNGQVHHQNWRINNAIKSGAMSKWQVTALRAKNHHIRYEQRAMARQDGGHITKLEHRALNQQESRVSA